MAQICLYFQLHQPYRLGSYSVLQLGKHASYFGQKNEKHNRQIFEKVTAKSYRPMLNLLYDLVRKHPEFRFSLGCTGIWLEQAAQFAPDLIRQIKKLIKSGQVELLAETYYHSLASLYSSQEFAAQVKQHTDLIFKLFGVKPQVFRNSELIYDNRIGELVYQLGFKAILAEGVDRYLGQAKRTSLARHPRAPLKILLKNSQLSDDIAFRFSDKTWIEYPLMATKFTDWLSSYQNQDLINLFMDFETFGEHQWRESGIFDFFSTWVKQTIKTQQHVFVHPSDLISSQSHLPIYNVPHPTSWADTDRDLTAWIGNELQKDSLTQLYALENLVGRQSSREVKQIWGKLQTSDHFYYMCTKWSQDGDVHAYFSPYSSPLEAYRQYSIVLADFIDLLRTSR